MAALKSQPRVKPLRINTCVVRQQLDELAPPGLRRGDRPLHQLLADTAAAAMRGDANVFDQAARGALRAQPRQDAELQAAYNDTVSPLRHHELDMRIMLKRFERP